MYTPPIFYQKIKSLIQKSFHEEMISFSDKNEAQSYFAHHFDEAVGDNINQLRRMMTTPDISEEVALYKLSIDNVVQLYAAALETKDPTTIDKAAHFLQEKLRAYADMVKIQAQLDSMSRDKITFDQLKTLLGRILDIISIECNRRGQHKLAEDIEETISEELNMQLNPRGTTLRPDRDVTEMIESVPRLPENVN